MRNLVLNPSFEVDGVEKLAARLKSSDTMSELAEKAEDQMWTQFVGIVASYGLPSEFEGFEKAFEPAEIELRKLLGKPSERPGGKRSLGTGMTLHPTVKSYKSVAKGAYEYDVELLDATGIPRGLNEIKESIKASKSPRDPEDKLMGAVDMVLKIYDACAPSDPRTVDAVNALINGLASRGFTLKADA